MTSQFDPLNQQPSETLRVKLEAAIKTHHPTYEADEKALKESYDAQRTFASAHPMQSTGKPLHDHQIWRQQYAQELEPLEHQASDARNHLIAQRNAAKKVLFATPEGPALFHQYFDAQLADIEKRHGRGSINRLQKFKGDLPDFLHNFAREIDFFKTKAIETSVSYPEATKTYFWQALGHQAKELSQVGGISLEEATVMRLETLGASPNITKYLSRIARHIEKGTFDQFDRLAWARSATEIGRLEQADSAAYRERAKAKASETAQTGSSHREIRGATASETNVREAETLQDSERAASGMLKRFGTLHWGAKTAIIGGTAVVGSALGYWAFHARHSKDQSPDQQKTI